MQILMSVLGHMTVTKTVPMNQGHTSAAAEQVTSSTMMGKHASVSKDYNPMTYCRSMHTSNDYVYCLCVCIVSAVPVDNQCDVNHPCQQLCAMVNGQIECGCEIGFVIAHDGISCLSKYIIRMFG